MPRHPALKRNRVDWCPSQQFARRIKCGRIVLRFTRCFEHPAGGSFHAIGGTVHEEHGKVLVKLRLSWAAPNLRFQCTEHRTLSEIDFEL